MRVIALTFALLLLLFANAGAAIQLPAPPAYQQSNCHCGENAIHQEPEISFWHRVVTDPIAAFTGILAIVTAILVIASIFQWFALREASNISRIAADAAKKSADMAERALIEIEGPYIYPVINDVEGMSQAIRAISNSGIAQNATELKIALKNFGRSPGFPGSITCGLYIGEADDDVRDPREGFHSGSILGAGEISNAIINRSFERPLGPQECRSMLDGQLRIYLKGWTQYTDLFENRYIQTFCLRWSHQSQQFTAFGSQRNKRKRLKDAEHP